MFKGNRSYGKLLFILIFRVIGCEKTAGRAQVSAGGLGTRVSAGHAGQIEISNNRGALTGASRGFSLGGFGVGPGDCLGAPGFGGHRRFPPD